MRIQTAPNPNPGRSLPKGAPQPAPAPEDLRGSDKIAIEWARQQAELVANGQHLVVDMGDGHRYSVAGTRISPAEKTFGAIQQFITAGVQEVQAIINAGPGLAMSGATAAVKPMITGNLPPGVTSNIDQWYQPGLMAATVGLGLISFVKNYKQHQQYREMGVDAPFIKTAALVATGASIATSALGLAGAVVSVAAPQYAGFATVARGVALGGNAVAFGMNYLDYFNERSQSYAPLGDRTKPD
ncbi:hypothetical protein JST97_20805 [bacterium]|nr:hypothetical protein [bacterium]